MVKPVWLLVVWRCLIRCSGPTDHPVWKGRERGEGMEERKGGSAHPSLTIKQLVKACI